MSIPFYADNAVAMIMLVLTKVTIRIAIREKREVGVDFVMSSIHFPSWAEQQSLFKLSCADAETCNQLSSVVCEITLFHMQKTCLILIV